MTVATTTADTTTVDTAGYVLRHADDSLIVAQRLAEWISRAPELEEDLALANMALDHLGVAQALLAHAGGGLDRTADELAFFRSEREYTNVLLVEQPNGDFGQTIARQFFLDAYHVRLWEALSGSNDEVLAGVAAKALKEARYHLRHTRGWLVRLGDGTAESHRRMQAGVDALWRYTGELFADDELDVRMAGAGVGVETSSLRASWDHEVAEAFAEATLERPEDPYQREGGRTGLHTEHLGHLLSEMQWMQRAYPGLEW